MKKIITATLTVFMLLSILTACTGISPEAAIGKGDEAFAANNLDQALEYYKQAGPDGNEKVKEVLTIKVLNFLKPEANEPRSSQQYSSNIRDALEFLAENASSTFTEEERYAFLAECIELYMEDMYDDEVEALFWAATDMLPVKIAALEEEMNNQYFLEGYLEFKKYLAEPTPNRDPLSHALNDWENCTAGPGCELYQAIKHTFPSGDYEKAFAVLVEHITETNVLKYIYNDLKQDLSFESIDQLFAYEASYYAQVPRNDAIQSLTKAFYKIDSIRLGNSHAEESFLLETQELEATCGLNPDGRVLFLHKPSEHDDSIGLYLPLMDRLPNAYYPYSLESVEYVILMSCDSVMTGSKFGDTTEELREDTTVTLYDVKTGEILFQTTCKGPTSMVMTYSGNTPPSVYSAGAPYVGSAVLDAITELETRINQ